MESIAVIMTTYDDGSGKRTSVASRTLVSLFNYLKYPSLNWIVADDGSQGDHIASVCKSIPVEVQVTNAERGGVGKSKNLALREAFKVSPLVLLLEDDWELIKPLNLEKHAEVLLKHEDVGIIRLGYLGGTMDASYEDFGEGKYCWRLKRGTGVYIYSGQVSLRHERFYKSVGWHNESTSPGEEELEMCKRFNATENAPDNLWPGEYGCTMNAGPFINIGLDVSLNQVVPE